jgi:hypothetical protein
MQRLLAASLPITVLAVTCVTAGSSLAGTLTFSFSSFDPPQALQGPGGSSQACGISNTGVIIGFYVDAGHTTHGYELKNGVYTTLDAPGAGTGNYNGTDGESVNSTGLAIIQSTNNGIQTSYLYKAGTYTPIMFPGSDGTNVFGFANGSFANSINDAGIVTGGYTLDGVSLHGFQFNVNTDVFTTLPDVPGATINYPQATSTSGDFTVNWKDGSGHFQGALNHNGSYTTLSFPGAVDTFTDGINTSGLISGIYDNGTVFHGLAYFDGKWYSIDYPGAAGTSMFYDNDVGQMVGYWKEANGDFHSLLVAAIPEPSCWVPAAVASLFAIVRLRRRRPDSA